MFDISTALLEYSENPDATVSGLSFREVNGELELELHLRDGGIEYATMADIVAIDDTLDTPNPLDEIKRYFVTVMLNHKAELGSAILRETPGLIESDHPFTYSRDYSPSAEAYLKQNKSPHPDGFDLTPLDLPVIFFYDVSSTGAQYRPAGTDMENTDRWVLDIVSGYQFGEHSPIFEAAWNDEEGIRKLIELAFDGDTCATTLALSDPEIATQLMSFRQAYYAMNDYAIPADDMMKLSRNIMIRGLLALGNKTSERTPIVGVVQAVPSLFYPTSFRERFPVASVSFLFRLPMDSFPVGRLNQLIYLLGRYTKIQSEKSIMRAIEKAARKLGYHVENDPQYHNAKRIVRNPEIYAKHKQALDELGRQTWLSDWRHLDDVFLSPGRFDKPSR